MTREDLENAVAPPSPIGGGRKGAIQTYTMAWDSILYNFTLIISSLVFVFQPWTANLVDFTKKMFPFPFLVGLEGYPEYVELGDNGTGTLGLCPPRTVFDGASGCVSRSDRRRNFCEKISSVFLQNNS